MTKYVHHIQNGILDARPDDITAYCEAVMAQSNGLVSGEIDLDEFVEDRLDDHEEQCELLRNGRAHKNNDGSREKHKAQLMREIPTIARAVIRYERAWWVDVSDDTHGLCGVTMVPDASSGHVVMHYLNVQDCSDTFPEAYSVQMPEPQPVVRS